MPPGIESYHWDTYTLSQFHLPARAFFCARDSQAGFAATVSTQREDTYFALSNMTLPLPREIGAHCEDSNGC